MQGQFHAQGEIYRHLIRTARAGWKPALGHPGTAAVLGCELGGLLAPAIGPGGETPPELAGEDACGTGAVPGCAQRAARAPTADSTTAA